MRKSHLNEQYLVLLGPIISRFLHVQMREKIYQNNKGWSLLSYLYGVEIFVEQIFVQRIFVERIVVKQTSVKQTFL